MGACRFPSGVRRLASKEGNRQERTDVDILSGNHCKREGESFQQNTRPKAKNNHHFLPPCRGKLATASAFDWSRLEIQRYRHLFLLADLPLCPTREVKIILPLPFHSPQESIAKPLPFPLSKWPSSRKSDVFSASSEKFFCPKSLPKPAEANISDKHFLSPLGASA